MNTIKTCLECQQVNGINQLCVPAKTTDGKEVLARVNIVTNKDEHCFPALTSDGKQVLVNFSILNLYAGGSFSNRIEKWSGLSWEISGEFTEGICHSITSTENTLYSGFTNTPGPQHSSGIFESINGIDWELIGNIKSNKLGCYTLSYDMTTQLLYAGGEFSEIEGVSITNIAKWNGSSWADVGSWNNGTAHCSIILNNNLYMAGNFLRFDTPNNICWVAKWNGSVWSELAFTLTPPNVMQFRAITSDTNDTIITGVLEFTHNSGKIVYKWNGSSWEALGDGFNCSSGMCTCRALIVDSDNNLYAGGTFDDYNGDTLNNVAKWNGSSWEALGDGFNGTCYTLALDANNNVYAGGDFTLSGSTSVNNVAKWNGSSWEALGDGVSDICFTLLNY